jgi:hypothetical protein
MMASTKTLKLVRSTRLAREGSFEAGAGADTRLPIGILTGDTRRHRAAMKPASGFPAGFFDDMAEVIEVRLRAYQVDWFRVVAGTNPQVRIRRITNTTWTEGSSATLSSSNGGGTTWPGPGSTATGEVRSQQMTPGQGWKQITLWHRDSRPDGFAKAWLPASLGGSGAGMNGVIVAQDGDDWTSDPGYTGTTNNAEWASDDWGDGGKTPELEFVFESNHKPSAPTVTSPEPSGGGDAVLVASTAGTELTIDLLFVDEDAGDACPRVEIEVYGDAATDDSLAPLIRATGSVTPTVVNATLRQYRYKVTGLPARTTLRFRVRTQDDSGASNAWGAWTSLTDGRVQTAYVAGVPLNPVMQTRPDGPHILGTINSPDAGDFATAWEGEFYRDTQSGRVTLWAPGPIQIGGAPTRSDVEYAGAALSPGDVVTWRHRHHNRDGVPGAWSPEYFTTIVAQVGPSISPGDTGTKLLSRTAQLTITFEASSDGYQVRLYRSGVLVHDTGVVTIGAAGSVNWNIPAGVANWGDRLDVEAASRPAGGSLGPFSPRSGLQINTLPSTTLTASA